VGFLYVALSLSMSKLRHYKDQKEETEAKIIFLLTWVYEWWNSDLAKDISCPRQHFENRLLCN